MAAINTKPCLCLVIWILHCRQIVTGHGICMPRDCLEVRDMGFNTSGVYHITPIGVYRGFDVYCDMETDDGGWLVFQRRLDGSVDFYRGWEEYQFGFGNLTGEHWLGNLPLFIITSQGHYELRVDLEDWEENTRFAKYRIFNIGHPAELYKLTALGYEGNAGDAMIQLHHGQSFTTKDNENDMYPGHNCANLYMGAWWYKNCHRANLNGQYHEGNNTEYGIGDGMSDGTHNGHAFSTKDKDNDARSNKHCAVKFKGAWWYNACHKANLNGLYHVGNDTGFAIGVTWFYWKGHRYSLKITEMKTRRIFFK